MPSVALAYQALRPQLRNIPRRWAIPSLRHYLLYSSETCGDLKPRDALDYGTHTQKIPGLDDSWAGITSLRQNGARPRFLAEPSQQNQAGIEPEPPVTQDDGSRLLRQTAMKPYDEMPRNERHQMWRSAHTASSPEIAMMVQQMLDSPLVPPIREYPEKFHNKISSREAQVAARRQVGLEMMLSGNLRKAAVPSWETVLELLKAMTADGSQNSKISALRIILPTSLDSALASEQVEFIGSSTGLSSRLKVSRSNRDPAAIVLRGDSVLLAEVAEELLQMRTGVVIQELGDIKALDYETKGTWPAMDTSSTSNASGSEAALSEESGEVSLHKESESVWLERPYEELPKPETWTTQNFERYISTLVNARLRPHLVLQFYHKPGKDGLLIDTTGIKIRMVKEAFMDPAARPHITPSALNAALNLMATSGGYRAEAELLLQAAEEWGIPMDTHTFNIMLKGYALICDMGLFVRTLKRMRNRLFLPNARTWLIFLEFVQKDEARQEIFKTMQEYPLWRDPDTARGVPAIMTRTKAYRAFKGGVTLPDFIQAQNSEFGHDWFTAPAFVDIACELLSRRSPKNAEESKSLTKDLTWLSSEPTCDGSKITTSDIERIIRHCSLPAQWDQCLWALRLAQAHGLDTDPMIYEALITACIFSKSPYSLGVITFYAILHRGLRKKSRDLLEKLFAKRLGPFWELPTAQPKIFSKEIAEFIENRMEHKARPGRIAATIQWAILAHYDSMVPVQPLYKMLAKTRVMDQIPHRKSPNSEQPPVVKIVIPLKDANDQGGRKEIILSKSLRKTMLTPPRPWSMDSSKDV